MTSVEPKMPRWLTHPEPVNVRIEACHWDPWGGEAVVVIRVGDKEYEAWVPRHAVTEYPAGGGFVRGVKIAEMDDTFYIAMPVSTITSPQIPVPKQLEAEILTPVA